MYLLVEKEVAVPAQWRRDLAVHRHSQARVHVGLIVTWRCRIIT